MSEESEAPEAPSQPPIRMTVVIEGDSSEAVLAAMAAVLKDFIGDRPLPEAPVTSTWTWSASVQKW